MFKKLVLEKELLKKVYLFFSVTTVIFGVFAFFNYGYWLVLTQGSLSLMMLCEGMDTILLKKQKFLGYLILGLSAFLFFVMINGVFGPIRLKSFR